MAETLDVTSMLPNQFEPVRKCRFILAIEGVDSFLISSTKVPSYTTDEIEIPFMNSTRYVAGKSKPLPMSVVLHSAIAPSGMQQVTEWMRTCFDAVSGRAGYADFYKRDVQLKLLDPVGTVISLFDIKGAWLQGDVDMGELSYEDAGMVDISVTLRFDIAVLQY
jgi:hypothetical protein